MLKIGLTGGIACGKSTACSFFSKLNVPVIDTDILAHQLTQPDSALLPVLRDALGDSYFYDNGELNRPRLRDAVFNDRQLKDRLESILHPAILGCMQEKLALYASPYVILAIPLLFEAGWRHLVDRSLCIDCSQEQQLERLNRRSQLSPELARKILASQLSREQRLAQCDDAIHNHGTPEELQQQVLLLHSRYQALAEQY